MVYRLDTPHSAVMVSTTMGIVLITTLVLSALLKSFTKFVGLDTDRDDTNILLNQILNHDKNHFEKQIATAGLSKSYRWWTHIDSTYL